ncbi:hypothetical protein G3N58_17060 [Paraburkholderia sp. Ac-20342]|uniref:hypothetical protein n=1 Tax=Paraburkholderia sp. Ac-20342 TaxID=2703889 RepID=UPI00198269B5|nr:hypothetical protein [Paraburkholderia sp. Ac-20342]MBN3848523.1 hypothetical protein [Paraburkholderia sp. Ac-20342]
MVATPFKPQHFLLLASHPAGAPYARTASDAGQLAHFAANPSFSVFSGERVLACGGLLPWWSGNASAWIAVAADIGAARMLELHHIVRRFLNSRPERRISADVLTVSQNGQRWARALGFVDEGRMRAYTPDGLDAELYARVRQKPLQGAMH